MDKKDLEHEKSTAPGCAHLNHAIGLLFSFCRYANYLYTSDSHHIP